MKIGALIVTFNRVKMLENLLDNYLKQLDEIEELLIVDNASTDGTKFLLKKYNEANEKIKVITLEKNLGGSGGFYTGLEYFLNKEYDWIYLSDDDAYFEKNIFIEFKNKAKNIEESKYSAICTSVINNNEIDLVHRRNYTKKKLRVKLNSVSLENYFKDEFELKIFSYVGVFINKKKLKSNSLPEKDYFIWYDDFEHSLTLSKLGKIVCWPNLKVHHNIIKVNNGEKRSNWKDYYGTRNKLLSYRKHFGKIVFIFEFVYKFQKDLIRFITFKSSVKMFILKLAAYRDVLKGKKGIHDRYKPGWK